jgi:hypothetical protein
MAAILAGAKGRISANAIDASVGNALKSWLALVYKTNAGKASPEEAEKYRHYRNISIEDPDDFLVKPTKDTKNIVNFADFLNGTSLDSESDEISVAPLAEALDAYCGDIFLANENRRMFATRFDRMNAEEAERAIQVRFQEDYGFDFAISVSESDGRASLN